MRRRPVLALALLTAVAGLAGSVGAQISPGPLATVHAELDGSRDCSSCHTKGEGVDPTLCLSCHQLLAERVSDGRGLHAQPGYEDCRICHIDHHGRDYELVWWGEAGMDAFDHRLAGEALTGAHRSVPCRDCHRAEFLARPELLREAGKDLSRTLLGLSSECSSCHQDEHRGQLDSRECAACHATGAWKPAAGFDHARSAFPLTGAHETTACAQCHREEADDRGAFQRFTPVAHEQCTACHRDAHEGALGGNCESCHATESWLSTPGFDHARTRYPLTGRHRRVACRDCHRAAAGQLRFRGLPFSQCSDCHSDPHEARLGADCATCHATASWSAVSEGRFDHAATRFELAGAHARVDCAGCHLEGQPLRIPGFEACSSCHADEHLGQFEHRADQGACDSCHSLDGFTPTLFTEERHQASRFPLTGLHRGVACDQCHAETSFRSRNGGETVRTAKFLYESLECSECHADPHAGTADRWLADGGCATCHSEAGWKVSVFDHSTTSFALAGSHAQLECTACHESEGATSEVRRLRLSGTPGDCAGCHSEPHGGQFASRAGGCASCHSDSAWSELLFDHNRDSGYRLEGAHAVAPCASCHFSGPDNRQATDPGRPIVRYVPLASRCEDCHSG